MPGAGEEKVTFFDVGGAIDSAAAKHKKIPSVLSGGMGAEGIFEWAGVGGAHPALLIISRSELQI